MTRNTSLPPFPVYVFPTAAADMVGAVAEFTQTDPGMAGVTALASFSTCAGGRVEVEIRPGWREPVNLFTATIAGPGERKSAVQTTMTRPLLDVEAQLAENGLGARLEAETAKEVARRAADQAKAEAGRAEGEQRDALLAKAIGAAQTAEAITVAALPRILADDVTPEAAATLLAEQGGRLAVISAEGGIFDIIAGRYSGNVPHLDVWLKGHSGDPLRIDRKGRAPEYIRSPALTLGLMIQPTVLETIARNPVFRGRGLLARFLYSMPPSRVGYRKAGAACVPGEIRDAWAELVRTLAITLSEWHDPAVLVLSPEARQLAIDIETHIEPQLGPGGELRHIADWGAKLTGATMRIAALLHLAQHPRDGWHRQVEVKSLYGAVEIAGYFQAHALAAFEAMRADPTVADAEYLLDVIRRLGKTEVSTRDLLSPQEPPGSPRSRNSSRL